MALLTVSTAIVQDPVSTLLQAEDQIILQNTPYSTSGFYVPANAKSSCWSNFRLHLNCPGKSFCLLEGCRNSPPLTYKQATSNMLDHNKAKHGLVKKKNVIDFQQLDKKKIAIRNLMIWLTTANRPTNLLKDAYLQPFLASVPRNFNIPSVNTINSAKSDAYEEVILKTKALVQKNAQGLVLVGDGYTEKKTHINYGGFLFSFIDVDWKIKFLTAEFEPKNGHTQESVEEMIQKIESDFAISKFVMVSDQGGDFKAAGKALGENRWHPCASHRLQCAINNAFLNCLNASCKSIKNRCRSTVSALVDPRADDFKKFQKKKKKFCPNARQLKKACPTRWWSDLQNMESYLENYPAICKVSSAYKITEERKLLLFDLTETLRQVRSWSRDLELETQITISFIRPTIQKIIKFLKKKKNTNIGDFCTQLIVELKSRFLDNSYSKIFEKTATFLDINVKGELDKDVEDFLLAELRNIDITYDDVDTVVTKINKKRAIFDDLQPISTENEIARYQSVAKNQDADTLEFWKTNSRLYPKLSIVARKILAIPATSARVERLFKETKFMVTDGRTNLKPETIKKNLTIKVNWPIFNPVQ